MFYVVFSSASMGFLLYLQEINKRLIRVTPASIKNGKGAFSLAYAKADAHLIQKFMYYNETVLCLTRKHAKLASFTDKDRPGIIDKSYS